ncbi:MAG: HAD-IC family P-type ATPase, partial [Nocardioides sp.]
MAVVEVATGEGMVTVTGSGYAPEGTFQGEPGAITLVSSIAAGAAACVTATIGRGGEEWIAEGDPMEAAIVALAARAGVSVGPRSAPRRRPFSPDRMMSSVLVGGTVWVIGAPEQVFGHCRVVPSSFGGDLDRLTGRGRRTLAVARREWPGGEGDWAEDDLEAIGLLGIEDPPRPGVDIALHRCRRAGIRVAMLTGDHPSTAAAIGREIGLLREGGAVLTGHDLPEDDTRLGEVLDDPAGVVVARVTPADKFRIARVLRDRGHVVAMTGDGVNDAPALREADVGVAMGRSGSDVAREAADLVLLDDNFDTIVAAVELGRATFRNVRRFPTYHLTDNVAELTPFVLWAATAGHFPLAIGVLQVLALDIGTDMLPALALGAEPASARVMEGRHRGAVVDRRLLSRAFGVLGATEAAASMAAFAAVLLAGGWVWGATLSGPLLATASGTAFAAISLCQMANAFACRSESVPIWRLRLVGNPAVGWAVAAEVALLVTFLAV